MMTSCRLLVYPAIRILVLMSICCTLIVGWSQLGLAHAQTLAPLSAIAWSPSGDRLATGHADGSVRIWSTSNNDLLTTFHEHTAMVQSLSWKPDGNQIISGSYDGTARVRDPATGEMLTTFPDLSLTTVLAVTWTLDSTKIIAIAFDTYHNFNVWDATTFQKLSSEPEGGDTVEIVWSPDQSAVAFVNAAGQLIINDPVCFQTLALFDEPETTEGKTYGVYAAAWSPDSTLIAGGNFAGIIRIWDRASGQILRELNVTDAPEIDRNVTLVRAIRFSADGGQLSAIAADGTLRTWDTGTGIVVSTEQLPGAPIYAAAWSPDRSRLAYGGEGGTPTIVDEIEPPGDRITDGLLALYTFEEGSGSVVHDVSGVGTPLDLTIGNPAAVSCGTDTLTVTSPTLIAPRVATFRGGQA